MREEETYNEVQIVSDLFDHLYNKFNKMQNKKFLYKELKDLTLIEINTIIVIGSGKMKSMSEIANNLGVSFGTPTVTIDRLMNKGFVERTRDIEDRRQVFVSLSQKGKDAYGEIIRLKTRVAEKVFGILDESERKMAIQLLSKLNNHFDEMFEEIK